MSMFQRTGPRQLPDRVTGFRSRPINELIECYESLRPIDSATVKHTWRPDGVLSHAKTPAQVQPYPFGDFWDFGIEVIAGGKVRVYTGEFDIGADVPVSLAQTDVTISSGDSRVFLQYEHATKALTVTETTGADPDRTDAAYIRRPLFNASQVGGGVSITKWRATSWQAGGRYGE